MAHNDEEKDALARLQICGISCIIGMQVRWIAFERRASSTYHIWVMRADGSAPWRLTSDGTHNFRPAWSPDSVPIAYNSDRSGADVVWIIALDGSLALRRLGQGFDSAWSRR